MTTYEQFLRAKQVAAPDAGIRVEDSEIHPLLKPHQRDIVRWALRKGRAAIFAAFGLGKSLMQLEIARLLVKHTGANFLIIAPLGVRQEFARDAAMIGLTIKFIRRVDECDGTGLYITNYESVRDGKIDPRGFVGVSLDEASVLRGFGGTKTFREFMRFFEGSNLWRFVATATPSPNEFIELLAYAAFLDVMDVGQAKTRFFKRDSTKADTLTLHEHKAREFWLWVSTWAIFLQRPSDLGYSDEGYVLPEMDVRWHEVRSDHTTAGHDPSGQGRLLRNAAIGVTDAAREKRDTLAIRVGTMAEIIGPDHGEQFIVWCDRNDEQKAVEVALDKLKITYSSLYGADDIDAREAMLQAWRDRETTAFVTKPVMYGAGVNLQQCSTAVFLGVGYKFAEFYQAIKRIHRFLQTRPVQIHIIYTEAEREIRRTLERKWEQHNELTAQMTAIIRQYGLASAAIEHELRRSIGVERTEAKGEHYTLVNNDCVIETQSMPADSVHLVLTSIPFSTQYEYTPSYNDFGHTDSNDHFWQQMDFLTPELARVLKPGRVAAIHVKDRIVPGGMTGFGFQTVYPFSDDCIRHFQKHGFAFLGRKTIVTDVVRENNQTYRLGWTEQCKDGSRMGAGMPEYLLLFRKPPTDRSNGYADEPVVKDKREYSRSRWQIDAHGFMRSSGNRLLTDTDFAGVPHERIFKVFREYSLTQPYNFERHVTLSESLERCPDCGHIHTGDKKCGGDCTCTKSGGRLPVTFMLLQPQSWHPDVWTDITRMLTLNSSQYAASREMHLCPMQLDLADRVIAQFSMAEEVVLDPFCGLGTSVLRAIKLRRRGIGIELSPSYYRDAALYCARAESEVNSPTLFDLVQLDGDIDLPPSSSQQQPSAFSNVAHESHRGAHEGAPLASSPEGCPPHRLARFDHDDEPTILSGADHA